MGERACSERLRVAGTVTGPAIRQAIRELAVPSGSIGLDAGCGAGRHTIWLAEAAGRNGAVIGLDISPENLAAASYLAAAGPSSGQVRFVQGDLFRLPFQRHAFDWVWCADTLWPVLVAEEPTVALREMARVVRPGGTVAVLYWSGQCLLSGFPDLEARLNAAYTAMVPYLGGVPPQLQFLRALGWLKAAGLKRPLARTFVAEFQAPLSPELLEGIAFCQSMLWENLEGRVSGEDWEAYCRLCHPNSNEFILDSPDYYGFVTYTLFRAEVPTLA